jgi:2-polyprenyl-6-methoxyphenol hydroxylase-like FAD-dependent oxidoreductase
MTFDVGPFALRGTVPDAHDGQGGFCPRRTVLDNILVEAASAAGVEVRTGFRVDDLIVDDGRVAGIAGAATGGGAVRERARVVIGADGVHSFVAKALRARQYDLRPVIACAFYSYFSGIAQADIELFVRDGCAFGAAPTHDGLHLVMVNWPTARFPIVRAAIERHVGETLEQAPAFAARVRAGRREEPWYGTAGVPNYFRTPYGPGWALVGDAGYTRDPITAQGISDAFLDAESLAAAIDEGLGGGADLDRRLAAHESDRNERVRPTYEFTLQLAALEPPPPAMQQLFGALHGNQNATNAFFSAITGAISLRDFLSEANLHRIMSAAGQLAVPS